MQIEVNVDPEQINKHVAESIIKSALGEKVQESINKRLNELLKGDYSYSSDNIIKNIVDEEFRNAIREHLRSNEASTKIREMVRRYFEEKFTDEILAGAFNKLWDKMFDRY